MRLRRDNLLAALIAFCVAHSAVAQIEKQAQTYDLTLDDCLTRTFTGNSEIRRLRTDVERAAGSKLVFTSRALPQLAAEVQGGNRGGSLYDPDGLFSILTARFSQPVVDVGIPASIRRGRLEVIIAQQSLNREVTDRLHEARLTYLRAQNLRDLLGIFRGIDQRLQANVDSEQQRLDVGTGRQDAVMQAKVQKLSLQRDIASLRNDYFGAVARLAELMGSNVTGEGTVRLPKPVGPLPFQAATVDLKQDAAYTLQNRADLGLLRALVEAAAADKRATEAGYFPFVSLVASTLFIPENSLLSKETEIVAGQETRSTEYRAGVSLSWRVIDSGQVTGARRRAESVRQGYAISLRQLEENIPRELAGIQRALENANAKRDALAKSAEAAEENLKLIEAQLSLGNATQLDFLKAQSNLLAVRAGIADATYAHETARAELDHATGRYLRFRPANNP